MGFFRPVSELLLPILFPLWIVGEGWSSNVCLVTRYLLLTNVEVQQVERMFYRAIKSPVIVWLLGTWYRSKVMGGSWRFYGCFDDYGGENIYVYTTSYVIVHINTLNSMMEDYWTTELSYSLCAGENEVLKVQKCLGICSNGLAKSLDHFITLVREWWEGAYLGKRCF